MTRVKRILSLAAAFLLLSGLLPVNEAIGAYFSSQTLSYTVVPDLSGVPTPTPTPTEIPGTGLVFNNQCSIISTGWNSHYSGNFTSASMTGNNDTHSYNFNFVFTVPDGNTEQYLKTNRSCLPTLQSACLPSTGTANPFLCYQAEPTEPEAVKRRCRTLTWPRGRAAAISASTLIVSPGRFQYIM
jgi:hypothetical protein